jgi:DNA-binding NarL/FixJ family response regulator
VLIRLGLFDDHDIVRAGFRYILSQHSDIEIVAEGATGREALAAIRAHPLDVCLIDLSLPDLSGMDVLRQAKGNKPDLAILILSAYSEEQYGLNVLKAGASGFVSKELAPEHLVAAVRTVAAGRRYVSPRLAEMLAAGLTHDIEQPAHLKLSEREFQIFSKLAVGKSVTEIANDLCLSTKTVSTYRARLLEKMNFKTNADLTQYAMRNNLMQ